MTFIHQKTMTNEIILESPPEIKTDHIQPSECTQKVEMSTDCYSKNDQRVSYIDNIIFPLVISYLITQGFAQRIGFIFILIDSYSKFDHRQ